jgi:hypothetical protein
MKSVSFRFNLDEKVHAEKNDFSGIVTMCAIQGNPDNPENIYYLEGMNTGGWYPERLLKEVK